MYITNDDLRTLIELGFLFNNNNEDADLLNRYNVLIEKLIKIKNKKNEINSKRIAEKRKTDPFYARRNTEKN